MNQRIIGRFSLVVFVFVFFVVLVSCRPVVSSERSEDYAFFPSGNNPGEIYDFSAIFENFWLGMNHNYVFWDRESVDWDAVYDEYKPKFAALPRFDAGVASPIAWTDPAFLGSVGSAFSYFREMTKDLSDGHLQLLLADPYGILGLQVLGPQHDNPFVLYNNIVPSLNRKWEEIKNGQETRGMFRLSDWTEETLSDDLFDRATKYDFIKGTIATHVDFENEGGYFNVLDPQNDYTDAEKATISQFMPRIAAGYIKDENILYIYAPYLLYYTCREEIPRLSQNGKAFPIDGFRSVMNIFFEGLKEPGLKGVIVDLRGVVGGSPKDLTYVWGRMITEPLTIGHQRGKSGEGRLDYGPWVPLRILPAPDDGGRMPDETRGKIPVVALADELTSSGAEFSIMVVHAMPNGYVIGSGERTLGTTSMPLPNQKYNAGVFDGSPLFSSLTVTGAQSRHLDGNVYEGAGIPVDALGKGEVVKQDWEKFFSSDEGQRKDTVLERAINYINEKNP
jgi:hypothetical protein